MGGIDPQVGPKANPEDSPKELPRCTTPLIGQAPTSTDVGVHAGVGPPVPSTTLGKMQILPRFGIDIKYYSTQMFENMFHRYGIPDVLTCMGVPGYGTQWKQTPNKAPCGPRLVVRTYVFKVLDQSQKVRPFGILAN